MKQFGEGDRTRTVGLFDWAKAGLPVWILTKRMVNKIEFVDYQAAVIKEVRQIVKKVLVVMVVNNAEQEYIEGMVFQRTLEPKLVTDLIEIPILNEAEILSHFSLIFKNDEVYCYCGPALIAINPYRTVVKTISQEALNNTLFLLQKNRIESAEPHVWTVSAIAYRNLSRSWTDQSICINGESGSGKTESIKKCLYFLAAIEQRKNKKSLIDLADRILACNPILESFGNCTTQNNDNSSRFGKYLRMFYSADPEVELIGAQMESYLLEKSRVVNVGDQQRSFHVFYAMCRAAPLEFQNRYLLSRKGAKCKSSDFSVFKRGLFAHKSINDEQIWKEVTEAFKTLEFTDEEQDAIWRILSAVLHMGNFKIDSTHYEEGRLPCTIVQDDDYKNTIKLLSCSGEQLQKALTVKVRIIKEKGDPKEITTPHPPEYVKHSANSMAKELYSRLFNWLFRRLNSGIKGLSLPLDSKHRSIGLLDIYGFEVDTVNTLDQLFINYTNEQLQNIYINHVFKNECRLFEAEGLEKYVSLITYQDNVALIKAIDSVGTTPGLFGLLNQVCVLNQTDEIFLSNLQTHQTDTKYALKGYVTFGKMSSASFVVRHSAKDVEYSVTGFVDSNKDEVPQTIVAVFLSALPSVAAVYREVVGGVETKSDVEPTNVKDRFTTTKFANGISSLMEKLSKNDCHFVRCIKPNNEKMANVWRPEVVLRQITYMGLLDSLKIRKFNYHIRYSYEKFYTEFQDLDLNKEGYMHIAKLKELGVSFKLLTENLLKALNLDLGEKEILFGRTIVFMNDYIHLQLEKLTAEKNELKRQKAAYLIDYFRNMLRKQKLHKALVSEASGIRLARDVLRELNVKLSYKRFKDQLRAIDKLQRCFRRQNEARRLRKMREGALFLCKYAKLMKIKKKMDKLIKAKRAAILVHDLFIYRTLKRQREWMRKMVHRIVSLAWDKVTSKAHFFIATTIQRHFRAHQRRQVMAQEMSILTEKDKLFRETFATLRIQAAARGFLVRRRLKRLTKSVCKIQGWWRGFWLSRYFKHLRRSAVKIQRAWRKCLIRRGLLAPDLSDIANRVHKYNKLLRIEYNNLFGEFPESFANREFVDSEYKKWTGQTSLYREAFASFIPPQPVVDLDHKARFCSIPIDVCLSPAIFDLYPRTWSKEVTSFIAKLHMNNERLLHIFPGKTCTFLVTDELRVYSFGMNDFGQTGHDTSGQLYQPPAEIKHLARNFPMKLDVKGDQAVMVTQSGVPFCWGDFRQSELSLNTERAHISKIVVQNAIKEEIIDCGVGGLRDIEGKRLLTTLGKSGKLYIFGTESQEKVIQKAEAVKTRQQQRTHKEHQIDFYDFENEDYLYHAIKHQQEGAKTAEETLADNRIKILSFELAGNGLTRDSSPGRKQKSEADPKSDLYRLTPIPNLNLPPKITAISCGCEFSIFTLDKGLLLAIGDNKEGQLGLGDKVTRETLVEILTFRKLKERVTEVSCGFKHVLARTQNGKVFGWGAGESCQNGSVSRSSALSPMLIPLPKNDISPKALPISVQATAFGSFLMFNDGTLIVFGKLGFGTLSRPSKLPYSNMLFSGRMREDFEPLKITCSWSDTISLATINFIDFRDTKGFESLRTKSSALVLTKWKQGMLLPSYDNNLANYMKSQCFLKPNPRPLFVDLASDWIAKTAKNTQSVQVEDKQKMTATNVSREELAEMKRSISMSKSPMAASKKSAIAVESMQASSNALNFAAAENPEVQMSANDKGVKTGSILKPAKSISVSQNETGKAAIQGQTVDERKSKNVRQTVTRTKSVNRLTQEINPLEIVTNNTKVSTNKSIIDEQRASTWTLVGERKSIEEEPKLTVVLTEEQLKMIRQNDDFESKLKRLSARQEEQLKGLQVRNMNPKFGDYSRSKSEFGVVKIHKSVSVSGLQTRANNDKNGNIFDQLLVNNNESKQVKSSKGRKTAAPEVHSKEFVQEAKNKSIVQRIDQPIEERSKIDKSPFKETFDSEIRKIEKNLQRDIDAYQRRLTYHQEANISEEVQEIRAVSRSVGRVSKSPNRQPAPKDSKVVLPTNNSPIRVSRRDVSQTRESQLQNNTKNSAQISAKDIQIKTVQQSKTASQIIKFNKKVDFQQPVQAESFKEQSIVKHSSKIVTKTTERKTQLNNQPSLKKGSKLQLSIPQREPSPEPPKIDPQIAAEVDKITRKPTAKWTNIDKEIMAHYASLVKKVTK